MRRVAAGEAEREGATAVGAVLVAEERGEVLLAQVLMSRRGNITRITPKMLEVGEAGGSESDDINNDEHPPICPFVYTSSFR